jgi:tetratricopeptide (TPR) repeat protein
MEGRWKSLIAAGVLCAITGCGLLDKKPAPMGTGEPPVASNARDDRRGKDGPVGANLLVQLGEVRIQAATDPNKTAAERESLCNEARITYEKALQQEPKNLEAMLGMARLYAVVKDKEKCVEWYKRASNTYPANAKIPSEEGKVLGAHFKDKDAAILCLHQATKLDPENRVYRKDLGFTLAWAGRYEEAYAWIVRVMPEAEARYNLAGLMHFNGHDDQAKKQLALALKANPNFEPSKQALASYMAPNERQGQAIQPVGYSDTLPVTAGAGTPMPANPQYTHPTSSNKASTPTASMDTADPQSMNMNRPGSANPSIGSTNGWVR